MRYLEMIAPSTAASRSASSKTMKGALPPSSSDNFFRVGAHCSISLIPTPVEPVNDSLRTTGFSHSSAPTSRLLATSAGSTLSSPAGMPARSASSARARAEKGVCGAGLSTMAHPAASAGPALRVIIALGKFHGVIAAVTPTGSFCTRMRLSAACAGITSP
ncbi:hypothetical protein D3C78_1348910 [compost metagenome]